MIVKNSAQCIEKSLKSYTDLIDSWTILDTGSTDGTQEIIKKTLKNIPGILYEEPFVDFATSRNRAFELAGTDSDFIFMPDDSYILHGIHVIKTILQKNFNNFDIYLMKIRNTEDDGEYFSPRIYKTSSKIRYKDPVHAHPDSTSLPGKIDSDVAYMTDVVFKEHLERTFERNKESVKTFLKLHEKDPSNTRYVWYLGKIYCQLHDYENALHYYNKRIGMKCNHEEEKFLACNDAYFITKNLDYLQKALVIFPWRAGEVYYHLFLHHIYTDKNKAEEFIKLAYNCDYPKHTHLAIDKSIYTKMIPKCYKEIHNA